MPGPGVMARMTAANMKATSDMELTFLDGDARRGLSRASSGAVVERNGRQRRRAERRRPVSADAREEAWPAVDAVHDPIEPCACAVRRPRLLVVAGERLVMPPVVALHGRRECAVRLVHDGGDFRLGR